METDGNEKYLKMTDIEIRNSEIEVRNDLSVENSVAIDVVTKRFTVKDRTRMFGAEVIGTAMLVFFGCMGCIDWFGSLGIQPPLNFGLTVMFVIQIFGHISGAIINPAVTVAALVNKLIDIKMAILFLIAQIMGASLGFSLLYALTPEEYFVSGLCVTQPHESFSVVRLFFVEFFLTSALVMIVCGVWDPRNSDKGDSAPLKIGLAVAALSFAGGPGTGASMNPVRSFGPALINWQWDYHWVYWVSPLSAGLAASTFYRKVFWPKVPTKEIKGGI